MGKNEAKKRADKGGISIGELRRIVRAYPAAGMSKLNPEFTAEQVREIFEKAIAERPDDEIPVTRRADLNSRVGRLRATRDHLLISNILRECA